MPSRPATPAAAKPRPAADHLRLVAGGPAAATASAAAAGGLARSKPAAAAARSLGDWLWHGLGAGAATASAGFATYALVFSTGEVVPSGDFNLFSRPDRTHLAAGAQRPDAKGGAPRRTEMADGTGVDFAPTGSVAGPPTVPAAGGDPGATLPNFTLRDVFDGKALVESRSSLSVVKPGSMLDGAGEVLSIEKRGERWVVLTQNGVIGAQRR